MRLVQAIREGANFLDEIRANAFIHDGQLILNPISNDFLDSSWKE